MIYTLNFPPNNAIKLTVERLMALKQKEWEEKELDSEWASASGFVKTPLEYSGRSGTYLLWLTYLVARVWINDEDGRPRPSLYWEWGFRFALQSVYETEPAPSHWISTLLHRQIDFFWPCYACQGESSSCEVCSYVASPQFGGVWMRQQNSGYNFRLPTQQFLFDLSWMLEQFRTLEYDSLLELYGQKVSQWKDTDDWF